MTTEIWVCRKCGSLCRVEISFKELNNKDIAERFTGECISGRKYNLSYSSGYIRADSFPEWKRIKSRSK